MYCAFKDDADQLARHLSGHGIKAKAYHAGLSYQVSKCQQLAVMILVLLGFICCVISQHDLL